MFDSVLLYKNSRRVVCDRVSESQVGLWKALKTRVFHSADSTALPIASHAHICRLSSIINWSIYSARATIKRRFSRKDSPVFAPRIPLTRFHIKPTTNHLTTAILLSSLWTSYVFLLLGLKRTSRNEWLYLNIYMYHVNKLNSLGQQ